MIVVVCGVIVVLMCVVLRFRVLGVMFVNMGLMLFYSSECVVVMNEYGVVIILLVMCSVCSVVMSVRVLFVNSDRCGMLRYLYSVCLNCWWNGLLLVSVWFF